MDCKEIKKYLSDFLEGELQHMQSQSVRKHIEACESCRRELELYEKSWELLRAWEDEEPEAGFVGRFWTRLAKETTWHERIADGLKKVSLRSRLAPALVMVCTVILVGSLIVSNYLNRQEMTQLAQMDAEEIELLEYMELAKNIDVIEEMEILQDMEIIESLDILGS